MNSSSEKRLSAVHPKLAVKVRELFADLSALGFTYEVVQGLRTYAEQDKLFAQGRTAPGPVVTKARGGESNHNFGLAVDVCPYHNGKLDWNYRAGFLALDAAAEKAGLMWGGDWKKFLDLPHLELPGPSLAQCRKLYALGKLVKVWTAVK
jgi:hypothetical protein